MSHLRVKTTYAVMGNYGSTNYEELFCHHNLTADIVSFYNKDGTTVDMVFSEWEIGNDLWDAMQRLYYPYKEEWGGILKDKVSFYKKSELKL